MDAFEQLGLIAEIAAALLGFIAVFLALSKTDGRFAQSDRHFIQALVMSASLAVVLALAPRALGLFLTAQVMWQTAAASAIALGTAPFILQARYQMRMKREESAQIHWVWHVVAWSIAIASSACFIAALVDPGRVSAWYVGGVSLLVPLCLWVFIGVVFRRFF